MPLHIIRQDITCMNVDAIVSPGNERLDTDGGVSGMLLAKGGSGLSDACRRLSGVRTGQAKLTRGFDLPCQYVIHTAGPIWNGGDDGEEVLLRQCYRSCLALAADRQVESLAFPLISAGAYGVPAALALRIAAEEIRAFLSACPPDAEMTVYLVLFSQEAFQASGAVHEAVTAYITETYVQAHQSTARRRVRRTEQHRYLDAPLDAYCEASDDGLVYMQAAAALPQEDMHQELLEQLRNLDESFSQQVLRLIDERGLTDAACYRRANIDRKLFSKLRTKPDYRPSKPTAVALAVALCLTLPETCELLSRAGYALSHANKFDIIVEFFIVRGIYDVDKINIELFAADMPLLGG